MKWRPAMALADVARHVIRCHYTQERRFQRALDDESGDIWQAL